MTRLPFVLLLLIATTGCGSTHSLAGSPSTQPAPPATSLATQATPDSIKWVRSAAEYAAALEQVYRLAGARVEAEARTRPSGSWAVVLDADETVISNVTYQEERARAGLGYSDESWNAWVRRREARPLPGAASFLARVHALGGRIAIVTNRLQSVCADTEAVFATYALAHDAMLCRQDGTTSDKNPRFEAVAAGRTPAGSSALTVIAYLGDNILDFPMLTQAVGSGGPAAFSDFGVRFFLVPNPMYGSWQ